MRKFMKKGDEMKNDEASWMEIGFLLQWIHKSFFLLHKNFNFLLASFFFWRKAFQKISVQFAWQ